MSVSGFKINGVVQKYNYNDLDAIDVQTGHIHSKAVTTAKLADGAVGTLQIDAKAVTAGKLGDDVSAILANKAEIDGSYEGMTVGNAEQLVSTVGIEDNAPYNFRTTGGSVDVGDRLSLNKVVGCTVAWNQLFDINGLFGVGKGTVSVAQNVLTFTASDKSAYQYIVQDAQCLSDHKILISMDITLSQSEKVGIGDGSSIYKLVNVSANTKTRISYIRNFTDARSKFYVYPARTSGLDVGGTMTLENVNICDLTQMFGSEIADYVYTLENATAGAGIAKVKSWGYFTKDYYPSHAASLESVKVSAHKMIGFNLWNGEYEVGSINSSTGADGISDSYKRSKYMRVVGGMTYCSTSPSTTQRYFWYDADKNFLRYDTANSNSDGYATKAAPSNACYLRTMWPVSQVNPATDEICINLSWDGERDGEYEAYTEHTYELDDVELRGIPKLDANNNLYYDGDEYTPDGAVARKYGIVDLSTLTWNKANAAGKSYSNVIADIRKGSASSYGSHIISTLFIGKETASMSGLNDSEMSVDSGGRLQICKTAWADYTNAQLQTALSGVYLVYELATPTAESADSYAKQQICDDFGTEFFVDAATRDFEMPVGHETIYSPNLRAKLEMAPNSPDGNGDYLVRQTNGINEYVPFSEIKELPDMPTTNGTYKLRCTVSGGTATLTWVTE